MDIEDYSNLPGKQILLMKSLDVYYKKEENINHLLPIIKGGITKLSLRIIDWFATNYTKKFGVIYYLKKTDDGYDYSETHQEGYTHYNVWTKYKSNLDAYSKKQFDPFCRNERIEFKYNEDSKIITTVGQLNFFRWAIDNHVLTYIKNHLNVIEKDMNSNIRKNSPKKKKGPKKNSKTQKVNHLENESSNTKKVERRKRRELSVAATKTLNKHRFNIVLDFS